MGFGPSAGWAQSLTDTVVERAGLPLEKRLHPSQPVPVNPPVWGAIEDDVWCVDETMGDDEPQGPGWLDRVGVAWADTGVDLNDKKTVNAEPGTEIQGYYVHPTGKWVGVSLPKRRIMLEGTLWLMTQSSPLVAEVDRLVGKHSFAHSARAPLRSTFEYVYPWLVRLRASRAKRAYSWPPWCWHEIALSAALLPLAQFSVDGDWVTRVECTDSSMSGLGRAWGHWPRETICEIARLTEG